LIETVDEASNLTRSLEKPVALKFIKKSLPMRNDDHCLDFAERPMGDAEMTAKFLSSIPAPTLSNICWHGNSCAPDFRCEPVYLRMRPLLRLVVDERHELNRPLPGKQIVISAKPSLITSCQRDTPLSALHSQPM